MESRTYSALSGFSILALGVVVAVWMAFKARKLVVDWNRNEIGDRKSLEQCSKNGLLWIAFLPGALIAAGVVCLLWYAVGGFIASQVCRQGCLPAPE